jgi:hypothetical protein
VSKILDGFRSEGYSGLAWFSKNQSV